MHQRSTAPRSRRWVGGILSLLLMTGCFPTPTKAPTGPKSPGTLVAGKPVASPSDAPEPSGAPVQQPSVPTLPIEVKAPIISHNGGNVIQGTVMAPAKIISHNGGNIVGNNGGNIISHNGGNVVSNGGGNIISHNGGNLKISQVPLANAVVRLKDAAGKPVKDEKGNELVTKTDENGGYKFPVDVKGRNLVVHAEVPGQTSDLVALLPKVGVTAGSSVSVDIASTLTLSYILELYVKGDLATFEKLPKDLESKARVQTEEAIVKGAIALPETLTSESLLTTMMATINSTSQVQDTFEEIRSLLVVFGVTREGDKLVATEVPGDVVSGVISDSAGNMYVFSQRKHTLWKVTPDGVAHTLLPFGSWGYSESRQSELFAPSSMAFDTDGSIILADTYNHRIVRVSKLGVVSVLAGGGARGFSGDSGPAKDALLNCPSGLAVDSGGNVYFSDTLNHRIRKISRDGVITTIAGNGTAGSSEDGLNGPNSSFNTPLGLLILKNGEVLVADSGNHKLRLISNLNLVTTLKLESPLREPSALASNGVSQFVVSDSGTTVSRIDGSRVTELVSQQIPDGLGQSYRVERCIALAHNGQDLFIGDGDYRLFKRNSAGDYQHVFGTGGDHSSQNVILKNAESLAMVQGTLYIGDTGANKIYRLTEAGRLEHIAGNGLVTPHVEDSSNPTTVPIPLPVKLRAGIDGTLLISCQGKSPSIRKLEFPSKLTVILGNGNRDISPIQDGASKNIGIPYIGEMTQSKDGTLYLADFTNGKIISVDMQGKINNLQVTSAISFDQTNPTIFAWDNNSQLNVLDFKERRLAVMKNGGLETNLLLEEVYSVVPSAEKIRNIVFDKYGNVYVASSKHVLRVSPTGAKVMIAGSSGMFLNGTTRDDGLFELRDICISSGGDLYILESTQLKKIDRNQLEVI